MLSQTARKMWESQREGAHTQWPHGKVLSSLLWGSIRSMFGCLMSWEVPQVQREMPIFTFLTRYVGAVLAGWKVKKGEREEVACTQPISPTSFRSTRLLELETDGARATS